MEAGDSEKRIDLMQTLAPIVCNVAGLEPIRTFEAVTRVVEAYGMRWAD